MTCWTHYGERAKLKGRILAIKWSLKGLNS